MAYNFDKIVDRRNTDSIKYDFALHRGMPKDVLPLWVADMDFSAPKEVIDTLVEKVSMVSGAILKVDKSILMFCMIGLKSTLIGKLNQGGWLKPRESFLLCLQPLGPSLRKVKGFLFRSLSITPSRNQYR